MKTLFQTRRNLFIQRTMKYLRYVVNDHFVLALLVLLGFLALQYRQLLLHFPLNSWMVYVLMICCSLLLFIAGTISSYIEEADATFLLPKEEEFTDLFQGFTWRSYVIWSIVQLAGQFLLIPIYFKLGWSVWAIVLFFSILTVGKYFYFCRKGSRIIENGRLNWQQAIAQEMKRQQAILQFFSLFTNVKGVTTSVRRRAYADFLLRFIPNKNECTWDYLFLRSFLRTGDYLALTLRLSILTILSLILVEESWLSIGMAVLFHYLLLFQLLPLYRAYDYQMMVVLFPLDSEKKKQGFLRTVRRISYTCLVSELLIATISLREKWYLFLLLGIGIVLNNVYLDIKSKKLID